MASFRIYACSCFLPCASPVRLARLHPALFRLNSRKESLIVASRPWSSFFQTTFCTHLPGVKPAARARGSEHENVAVAPEGMVAAVVSAEAEGGEGGDSRLVHVELQKEMAESYLSYAMSVLLGRALPDVRDGLKPVHRRILFAMHELGLASRKPFKKCARVVGEVLGKFHPHGDSAVYDALVRMAQDFSLRSPLIAGHGNFGSLDADPPAAMRYTECRLDPLAEEMLLADLGQDTVAFTPNFDGSQQEPSVFPARLPNILLNGASGIAVGMATNIPPHNLGEVVDALCALIHNSNATVQELMEFLPGPDFPTGGQILGTLGILAAYRTGRGKIIVRGTVKMEEATEKNQRSLIVITEIPFQTNKAALVKQMSDLVENKTLEGISDLLDESDRDGMRVVVEVKRGANAAVVLNNLYKHTKLQTSFNCNIIGIVDGKPELMGLKEILQSFLEFRCSVVTRRANYMLKQAEDRDHIIKGMLIGLEHLDLFVETTRNAENASVASELLQKKLNLTHVQADALLSMTVRRFTGLERKKLAEEHTHLESQINDLKALLASKTRILQLVEKEALALKRDFSTPRRTNLVQSDDGELSDIDIIANEDALVVISERGYIKRMKPLEFAAQRRGTWGKSSGKLKTNDTLSDSVFCRTHDYLLFFSEKGIVYSTRVFQIPELSRTATGTPLVQLIHIPLGERITSIKAVTDFPADQFLVMLTAFGYIKRTPLQLFSGIRVQGITAIQLGPGDELKLVKLAAAEDTIVIGSQHGNVIRVVCDETRFRALSRHARGVKSMRFKDGDKPAAMDIVQAGVLNNLREKGLEAPWLLFVTGRGYGKRVPLSAFPVSRLGRVGVRGYNFIHKEDWLASIFLVGTNVADDGETTEEVILASNGGVMNRFKVRDVSTRKNRITSGIMLMRLEENDKVNSVSLVSSLNSDENSEVLDEQALEIIEP